MTRALRRSLLATVFIAVLALAAAACAPARVAGSPASTASGWPATMLAQVNAQRAGAGLSGLAWCPSLARAAQGHSNEQAASQTMTHDGSGGMVARAQAGGYNGWNTLGENVAAGASSVDQVMGLWLNSAPHRANILNPAFTHFGAGEAVSNQPYWTQDFGAGGAC